MEIWLPLVYAAIAGLWILFSDWLLGLLTSSPASFTHWSIYKGWFYVLCTAGLLYLVLHRHLLRLRRIQRRLRESEASLREANRRKDEFLMMLSHELRNPVAPIRTAVELMKLAGDKPATLARQVSIIERQVRHLSRLLDDLLDIARITRGAFQLRLEPVDLRDVIGEAIETSLILSGPRKDDFSSILPAHAIMAEVDPVRLVQVICNLIANAAKFSEPGQRITLSLGLETGPSSAAPMAVIRVEDQGVGIEPDLLPQIFEPFVQADQSLDRTRGGLGIGLTLSRKIVDLHGGRIEARSPGPFRGSTFSVTLPALAASSRADQDEAPPYPERRTGSS